MKSEADFINEAKQYRMVDTATLAADFKRIYNDGRRDQVEADLKVMREQWKSIRSFPMWEDHVVLDGFEAAIRVAGPGENE